MVCCSCLWFVVGVSGVPWVSMVYYGVCHAVHKVHQSALWILWFTRMCMSICKMKCGVV